MTKQRLTAVSCPYSAHPPRRAQETTAKPLPSGGKLRVRSRPFLTSIGLNRMPVFSAT